MTIPLRRGWFTQVARFAFWAVLPLFAFADEAPNLANDLEALKQETLSLNRDLLILEEELLYPASSQVALYLSMDVGEFFELDSVRVLVNGQMLVSELYTAEQVQALYRGGVQRLYVGNLSSGEHEISAFFTGKGPRDQDYKRAAELTVNKRQEPLVLELRIVDSTRTLQPVFDIKEWQLQ
ncbi:AraC family transcriptional regulator [Marinimicrobium sp. ABcell2]|uniref:AraC family transcriptional regulator n=1 Tax=Marinimicrobium sp. ABcell2 TaxID=3069751 RepID=UPI0027B43BB8|nr:AraC family transcriptional regulator [Marinimicrobium sp. ABcell2]MDQ2076651.1 AraC family transcriptional regulator [Marinimicrobium sp. ABcell2]